MQYPDGYTVETSDGTWTVEVSPKNSRDIPVMYPSCTRDALTSVMTHVGIIRPLNTARPPLLQVSPVEHGGYDLVKYTPSLTQPSHQLTIRRDAGDKVQSLLAAISQTAKPSAHKSGEVLVVR